MSSYVFTTLSPFLCTLYVSPSVSVFPLKYFHVVWVFISLHTVSRLLSSPLLLPCFPVFSSDGLRCLSTQSMRWCCKSFTFCYKVFKCSPRPRLPAFPGPPPPHTPASRLGRPLCHIFSSVSTSHKHKEEVDEAPLDGGRLRRSARVEGLRPTHLSGGWTGEVVPEVASGPPPHLLELPERLASHVQVNSG